MDQKTWLWRRRSLEKTILANSEEAQSVCKKEVDLEISLRILNEKLASAVDECSFKDELVQNYKKEAGVYAADKKKAGDDLLRLRRELEEARLENSAVNERLGQLSSALEERMSELSHVQQEKDRTSKRVVSLTSENSYLTKVLTLKEKLVEEINGAKIETEAEFEALMARLDAVEKENAFLRYEFRSLEKELQIKNEELECSCRSLEGSNKIYLENVKKIKKLEGECQRLRSLTRKAQGRNQTGARRNSICNDDGYCSEKASKKVSFLLDQVQDVFKDSKTKHESQIIGASEMRLMDDFVEMEKLAVDSPEIKKTDDWLQTVTNMVLEQHEASSRSVDELLEDVRTASYCRIRYITWKTPPSSPNPPSIQEWSTEMSLSITKLIGLISTFASSSSEECDSNYGYEVHVFRWRKRDLTAVLQEFIDSCKELLDRKASFDKFTRDSTRFLEMIINTCVSFQEDYNVREEFQKHLGGEGPGTALELESVQNLMLEMEKMHLASQVEIKGLKRRREDELENLMAMNEELDTQLNVTKAELNQLMQRLNSAEIELDSKSQCCEELEGAYLELQLQLESMANSQHSENQENEGEKLQTGMEISKACAKLAECEETMMKLGKELKALGSAETKRDLKQRSSLLDQMMSEDNGEESPKTKEVICSYKTASFSDETPATIRGSTNETRNVKSGALAIVPSTKREGEGGGGAGFLRKLLLRRKKSSKNTSIYFGK